MLSAKEGSGAKGQVPNPGRKVVSNLMREVGSCSGSRPRPAPRKLMFWQDIDGGVQRYRRNWTKLCAQPLPPLVFAKHACSQHIVSPTQLRRKKHFVREGRGPNVKSISDIPGNKRVCCRRVAHLEIDPVPVAYLDIVAATPRLVSFLRGNGRSFAKPGGGKVAITKHMKQPYLKTVRGC